MSNQECKCPNCGEPFTIDLEAVLPDATDLTLSLGVTPGEMMRLDTIAGALASFRDLQRAVGESMGFDTEVYLKHFEVENNEFRVTTRIANTQRVQSETPA